MYEFHLKDMIQALTKQKLLKKKDEDKALKILKRYWTDKIAITWCAQDVKDRAKERKIKINEYQAKEVLDNVFHNLDCTVGVTWDTLDFYIDQAKGG